MNPLNWIVSSAVDHVHNIGMVTDSEPYAKLFCIALNWTHMSHAASIVAGKNVLVIRESGRIQLIDMLHTLPLVP